MSNKMQLNTVYFICKLLYMFRVVSPPIISSTNKSICSIWYWSIVVAAGRHCGGASLSNNGWLVPDAVDIVICVPDDGWRNHPKHIEQFTDKINCVHFNHVGLSLTYFNVALQTKKNQSLCNKSDQSETNLQWYYVLHQLIHSPSLVQNTLLTESQSFLTLSGWTTYIYVAQWAL